MTVLPFPTQPKTAKQTRRSRRPTKCISLRQARNMMEGLSVAPEIGMPLNTHLIIHWGGTLVSDDADGKLFAKLRYLLDKRLRRKCGIPLTGIWVRERHRNNRTRQQSEVVHSHLLLHLPFRFREAARQDVQQLVTIVAGPILDDRTIELTFPANPDGKYFLKGGTRAVWEEFRLPAKWRSRLGEGVIPGKRCGVTQNIGPAARQVQSPPHPRDRSLTCQDRDKEPASKQGLSSTSTNSCAKAALYPGRIRRGVACGLAVTAAKKSPAQTLRRT